MSTKSEVLAARLERVSQRLALYVAAETAILQGAQSYSIGNRTLTRADLRYIQNQISRLEKQEMQLVSSGVIKIQRVIPRDI